MIIKLGWYESTMLQSINGYTIKSGYEVYVPEITIHEDIDKSSVTVRLGEGREYKLKVETFKKRFRKSEGEKYD